MSKRIQQVNELIKRELSQILLKEMDLDVDDQSLKDVLVTVTRVETSDNLSQAKVYISVMPEDRAKRILGILERKIYYLQQKINKRLKMRPVPQIKFLEEKETVRAGRIEAILEKLKKEEK